MIKHGPGSPAMCLFSGFSGFLLRTGFFFENENDEKNCSNNRNYAHRHYHNLFEVGATAYFWDSSVRPFRSLFEFIVVVVVVRKKKCTAGGPFYRKNLINYKIEFRYRRIHQSSSPREEEGFFEFDKSSVFSRMIIFMSP